MLIQTFKDGFNHRIPSEITPHAAYQGRRDMLKMLATGAAGATLASWAARDARAMVGGGKLPALVGAKSAVAGAATI
jgi:methionine sulfoxide reductase catalytic subunit